MSIQDSEQQNIPLAVVGISHNTAELAIREKAVFTDKQQSNILNHLSKNFNTRGAIVLSTCNRTEIYVCGRKATKYISDICTWLDDIQKENIFCNEEIVYIQKGREAVRHFFKVISALDSQIIGEPQITGQVKEAYEKSHQSNYTELFLNKMYNFGMQVEKSVRSKTYLSDGAVSISFAGVELARKIFGNLQDSTVLLIGAGETAELAALHFKTRDVPRIIVANRTFKTAQDLAAKFDGDAFDLENLEEALNQANIVISATASDVFILDKQMLERVAVKREYKPLFLIDLAVPRDIDPSVTEIDGIFLYNLEALQEVVQKNIDQRKKEVPKAEKIIENHVSEYIKWYNTLPIIKTITKLSHHFEDIREKEFERLKNRFPEESLVEAEYLSKSLMKKFLHHHIVTYRSTVWYSA